MSSLIKPEKSLNPKILIIDDCLDSLELLSIVLSEKGYELELKNNGYSIIREVKKSLPDLILLDICMPGINGFEVCQILKSDHLTRDIPIIFLTALHKIEDKARAFEFGGDDYITKPFDIQEISIRVDHQLKKYHGQLKLKKRNISLERDNQRLLNAEQKLLSHNQKLNRLATLDSLTQIANRYQFDQFLAREWKRSAREQYWLSLILIDIDYFKLYNDSLGHQAGDVCIKKVARAISKTIKRPADLVARYGGEEFAAILPQTSVNNALLVAEKIRLEIKQLNLSHPTSLVSNIVSLSLGVSSVIPGSCYTIKQLLVTADKALYQAKKQGRDRVVFKSLDRA